MGYKVGTGKLNILSEMAETNIGIAGLDIIIDADGAIEAYLGTGGMEFGGRAGFQSTSTIGTAKLNLLTEQAEANIGIAGLDVVIDADGAIEAYLAQGGMEFGGISGHRDHTTTHVIGTSKLNILTEQAEANIGVAGIDVIIDADFDGRYIVILTTQ
jgi:hypothetical protein